MVGGSSCPPCTAASNRSRAVQSAAPFGIPVTAKFRMGLDDSFRTDRDAALICADEGVAWVAMHARTVEQHYSGDARWGAITQLKEVVVDAGHNIPVLGNGDIWEAQDAIDMMTQTGCDGVVIGRGCLGRLGCFPTLSRRLPVVRCQQQERWVRSLTSC